MMKQNRRDWIKKTGLMNPPLDYGLQPNFGK